ncbi:hypothetical protein Tco_0860792 [Tanacetum coccineum]|uniref:Uncharacterized protein n=1 Tax=Tanacetum coccineum TaxID=301880 RepID=A0ABQ5BFY7_9ASTR
MIVASFMNKTPNTLSFVLISLVITLNPQETTLCFDTEIETSRQKNRVLQGAVLKGAESALKLKERRLQMYNEAVGKDFDSKMGYESVSHR